MTKLPAEILIPPTTRYRIDTGYWLNAGMCSPERGVIGVKQSTVYKMHETLLHEILHAVEKELVNQGRIEKESDEKYIEELGRLLFASLLTAGLYNIREEPDWYQEALDLQEAT